MKTSWFGFAGSLSVALLAAAALPGCGSGSFEDEMVSGDESALEADDVAMDGEEMELGALEQQLQNCSTPDGTNAVMAAFAVSVGQELKRWQARRDFVVFNTNGWSETSSGWEQAIKLTSGIGTDGKPQGKSRCADGKCAKVQAILDMQYEPTRGQVYIQGETSTNKVLLDPSALRSRMAAKLGQDQRTCDEHPKDNDQSQCPVETHLLTPLGTASLGGCGVHYKFSVTKDASGTLLYPAQLKNKLRFADASNGWVDFRNLGGGVVAIDPTYGLNEGVNTGTGSCTAACTKISSTNVAGHCCSCSGATKTFVKSPWSASTFLCK